MLCISKKEASSQFKIHCDTTNYNITCGSSDIGFIVLQRTPPRPIFDQEVASIILPMVLFPSAHICKDNRKAIMVVNKD
jgi:hypothetical protein